MNGDSGALERIAVTQSDRDHARSLLGLGADTTDHTDQSPLRAVMRESGTGWYVVLALGALGLADTLQGYAFGVMAPEIARALGVDRGEIATLNAVKTLATLRLY